MIDGAKGTLAQIIRFASKHRYHIAAVLLILAAIYFVAVKSREPFSGQKKIERDIESAVELLRSKLSPSA